MNTHTLPDEAERALDTIKQADIVIGIPSFNNARTIAHVVQACYAGLSKYFPERRGVVINSDGGSTDETGAAVLSARVDESSLMLLSTPLYPVHRLSFPYHGVPGKGSAFRMVFEMARRLQARACAVVDSDLRSITPEWIDLLVRPVLLGKFDFVAPYYHRHKYDGTITNSIVYPLTRMLYGVQVRQPIGGDFGISPPLLDCYLKKDVWETDVARFGIDIWMTTVAVAEGFRVCKSFLGAKLHDAKDPGADLSAMLQQVVGSVFSLMQEYEPVWREKQGSSAVPLFGFRFDVGLDPIHVDVQRMLREFRRGSAELGDIWSVGMQRGTLSEIRKLASETVGDRVFHLDDGLWAKVVLDFSMAYRINPLLRGPLLRSLTPLYLARVASFVMETEKLTAHQVEERIEALCASFESLKPYLISLWSGAPVQEAPPVTDKGGSQEPGSGGNNAVEVGNV
jgi:glycosyltransferase involved in cell wall biosynthesis